MDEGDKARDDKHERYKDPAETAAAETPASRRGPMAHVGSVLPAACSANLACSPRAQHVVAVGAGRYSYAAQPSADVLRDLPADRQLDVAVDVHVDHNRAVLDANPQRSRIARRTSC